jgi:hypothetical protein
MRGERGQRNAARASMRQMRDDGQGADRLEMPLKLSGEACEKAPCCDNQKINEPAMTEWSRDAAL